MFYPCPEARDLSTCWTTRSGPLRFCACEPAPPARSNRVHVTAKSCVGCRMAGMRNSRSGGAARDVPATLPTRPNPRTVLTCPSPALNAQPRARARIMRDAFLCWTRLLVSNPKLVVQRVCLFEHTPGSARITPSTRDWGCAARTPRRATVVNGALGGARVSSASRGVLRPRAVATCVCAGGVS